MVKEPREMEIYRKQAKKAKDKIMSRKCKNCSRTMEEGGISGTPGLCASCLRGE